jgi:hypothetical protein
VDLGDCERIGERKKGKERRERAGEGRGKRERMVTATLRKGVYVKNEGKLPL